MTNENGKKETPTEGTPWGHVLLIVGAGIVVCFQVGKAPPVIPSIRAELDMSLFSAGWILSSFNIIGLLLGSIIGALSDAFGHRRLLLGGLICQAAGSLMGALTHAVPLLLATRVLEGMGYLMAAVSAPSLITRLAQPGDLRLALSIWSTWLPAGSATIMLVTPAITFFFGWRGLWLINAAILAGYAVFVSRCTISLKAPNRRKKVKLGRIWRDIRTTSTSMGPILLALSLSAFALQWLAVMGFLPTLLIEDYGLSKGKASVLTGIMVGVCAPGNLLGGWLLLKGFRRWHLIALSNLAMGCCSLAIYQVSIPFSLRYFATLAFSGIGGLLPAAVLSGAPVHSPREKLVATTNGLIMQGAQLGQVLGPPLLALIVSNLGGWQAAPILLVPAAGLGILLSFGLAALEGK